MDGTKAMLAGVASTAAALGCEQLRTLLGARLAAANVAVLTRKSAPSKAGLALGSEAGVGAEGGGAAGEEEEEEEEPEPYATAGDRRLTLARCERALAIYHGRQLLLQLLTSSAADGAPDDAAAAAAALSAAELLSLLGSCFASEPLRVYKCTRSNGVGYREQPLESTKMSVDGPSCDECIIVLGLRVGLDDNAHVERSKRMPNLNVGSAVEYLCVTGELKPSGAIEVLMLLVFMLLLLLVLMLLVLC